MSGCCKHSTCQRNHIDHRIRRPEYRMCTLPNNFIMDWLRHRISLQSFYLSALPPSMPKISRTIHGKAHTLLRRLLECEGCSILSGAGQIARGVWRLSSDRYIFDKVHTFDSQLTGAGPREVSILDPAAIPIIYGPNTKCTKSTWYSLNGLDSDKVSIGGIRDPAKYRLRRRAWDRGLSIKCILACSFIMLSGC